MSFAVDSYARWFPTEPDREGVSRKLAEFYRNNAQYHAMTSGGGKANHPHVQILSCLIHESGTYAEVGCGGGVVCGMIGRVADVVGIDVSAMALRNAGRLTGEHGGYLCQGSADALPLRDGSVDGAYAFEVLEHVWNPVAVVQEMARIVKPGGFVLASAPNPFSLDLHLNKRMLARLADIAFALARWIVDSVTARVYVNIVPDIGGEVYPDCDMISAINPFGLARCLSGMGCMVEFCDTTYMCAHREGSRTTLDFQRNTARPFLRHFGDHMLILARKI